MIKTIFILFILYFLIEYFINQIKSIKTDNDEENEKNFWMFTYDFKDKKKESIFDVDSHEVIEKRSKKNRLILFLYLSVILVFIFLNSLVSQILNLILN